MKQNSTVLRFQPLALATLCAIGMQPHVSAAALEEVFVTAQKRVESAQDTPISMAAFNNQQLERQGITDLTGVRDKIPNFQISPHPNSAATTLINIRGVGNTDDQITLDPRVAVYVDNVYVARSQGLAMEVADIERIEVLRGPQGSLYGRNATGGAVNFHTRAPRLGEMGLRQDVSVGNRSLLRHRTSVNLPLGDTAAAEVTWLRQERDGFVDNRGTGVERFGDQDREAWRAALLWDVGDSTQVRYTYDRSIIEDTPAFLAAVPLYPATGSRPSAGSPGVRDLLANDITAQGHNLTVDWEIAENLTFKSITAYRDLDNFNNQNYHTGVVAPLPLFANAWWQEQDQFTQEFQLTGDALDGRLEYVAGLYYFDESADSRDQVDVPLQNFMSRRTINVENRAYAVFGQASWRPDVLDERLKFTVGLRWSKDEREARMLDRRFFGGQQIAALTGQGDNDFSDVSPSLIVAYDLGENTNLYAKVVSGYKTGGFNIRASSIQRFEDGFDQEELISWEVGAKTQLLENRLRVNVALFTADYDDIQLSVSDPVDVTRADILNAGEATVEGLELDVTALLGMGFQLTASYGYVNSVYEKVIDEAGRNLYRNYQFVDSPEHTWNVDLEYSAEFIAGSELTASLGYSWSDERFGNAANDRRYRIDDYGLLNARVGVSDIAVGGDAMLRVALWGRNLEDKEYYLSHFPTGVPTAIFGEPRSYGVDLVLEL